MNTITPFEELANRWREEADQQRTRFLNTLAAHVLEMLAGELSDAIQAAQQETLTLSEAAQESRYSAEHLGRLVRTGKIPNAGRHNAPRVRRCDVPRKASGLPQASPMLHIADRQQVARSIIHPND